MTTQDLNTQASYHTYNGLAPLKQPRAMKLEFDFSVQDTWDVDLTNAQSSDKLEWIQTFYVDNRDNTQDFELVISVTNQRLVWPAGWEGYLPVLMPNPPKFYVRSTGSEATILAYAITVPLASQMWGDNVTAVISGEVDVNVLNELLSVRIISQAIDLAVIGAGDEATDYSANAPSAEANLLATIPANTARAHVEIQNQSAEQIQVILTNSGNDTVILLASAGSANTQGGAWTSDNFKGEIKIYSSNAASQISAFEV